ncbi:hypothetical protein RUND412_000993 [Rhizina undulata]
MKFHLSSLLLLPLSLTSAFTLHGSFPPAPPLLPNPSALPPSTAVTLTTGGTSKTTLIQRDNKFVFRNVSEGSYLLDVVCPTYHFLPLRVDVDRDGEVKVFMTFRGNEWSNLGEKKPYPIELRPVKEADYYIVREGFNPTKLLGSPMILVALFSLVSIVFLPKIIDKLDPELKAEFEDQQRKTLGGGSAGAPNPMGNFDMASFLAGKSSPNPQQSQQQQQGKGGRR